MKFPFRRQGRILDLLVLGGISLNLLGFTASAQGQLARDLPTIPVVDPDVSDSELEKAEIEKETMLIESIVDPKLVFRVDPSRSRIVRAALPVTRIAITNPELLDVNEFSPNEFEVIGLKAGETTMTLWFTEQDGKESILRYLVKIGPDELIQKQAEVEFGSLQDRVNELFPESRVQLIPVADKLVVRGQVRDAKEAAEILSLLSGEKTDRTNNSNGAGITPSDVARFSSIADLPSTKIVNLLRVPGEHQVMLKVRIAEINRDAVRELGLDFEVLGDNFSISHFLGGGGNMTAILDNGDVNLFIKAFSSNGVGKILAEPTLVTISGKPANFLAGGEFAVPTAVGVDGVNAVSTNFQRFGTQLNFTPTVVDKDKIRLQVQPSFSSIDQSIAVNGIPGLNSRGAMTTVELREGQWLAIAGLIQDTSGGRRSRLPHVGDVPVLGAALGSQKFERRETELVILVSPELVHPLEPDQVPLFLPGMDVTEPTDREFFCHQQIEGLRGKHYRSTIWPAYRYQLRHDNKELRDAYKEAKSRDCFRSSQSYYMSGSFGFSK